jgi:hypothetical protein
MPSVSFGPTTGERADALIADLRTAGILSETDKTIAEAIVLRHVALAEDEGMHMSDLFYEAAADGDLNALDAVTRSGLCVTRIVK